MTMITDHSTGYMTNKKETSHEATGCLNEMPKGGLHIADFNFLLRMDGSSEGFNGWFHIVAPQTLAVPPDYGKSGLFSDQFLLRGHQYISGAFAPFIIYTNRSKYTMDVVDGYKILRTQPVNPDILPPDFPMAILQKTDSYLPPTYINRRAGIGEYFDIKLFGNSSVFANLAQYRGNKNTLTALTQHYRWAYASEKRLHDIQKCTIGMHVRYKSWDALKHQLPCSSCVVGQIRK